ncbi:hypothetical protein JOF53_003532 [Crossiella equi]|uniref:DUF1707 domain-containing protein n=1 Tax=Crossiella equi TaxID=130796 RepID=A0ABS5ADK2_9PSEU|nr:DUF1707 domain-containing protein [Crossiella equi]MBP2474660.1 hypothetical protein [Crossiella equi]
MSTHADHVELRIGDTERTEAERLLGEHLRVGRLTAEEFGERANVAASARTRRELSTLFEDLPAPHPTFELPAPLQYQPAAHALPPLPPPSLPRPDTGMYTAAKVLGVLVAIPTAGATVLVGGMLSMEVLSWLPRELAMLSAVSIGILVLMGIVVGLQRLKP